MEGHIHKRIRTLKDGSTSTRWYVVLDIGPDLNGRRRQKWHSGFRTRREAEAARARLVNEIATGLYVPPSTMTVAEWANHWLPNLQTRVKPSTFDSYRRNLQLHILPALGSMRLQKVTPMHLTNFYGELLVTGRCHKPGGLSSKSVKYVSRIIHGMFRDAVDAGALSYNPASRAKPPSIAPTGSEPLRYWDAEDLATFLRAVRGDRLEALWRMTAMTGMRRGEVLGLRWDCVDFENSRVSVQRSMISVSYKVMESATKTWRARVVDLDEATAGALRAHRGRQNLEKLEWGDEYDDDGLVFPRENGTPLQPDLVSQRLDAIIKREGLRRIRFHDLRHTHATLALRAGVPTKVVTERLGHHSPAFTLKYYAHVTPGMQADAAAQVAALVDSLAM